MPNRSKRTLCRCLALPALLSAACASLPVQQYAGPRRPASEVATVVTERATTQLMVIDGARTSGYYHREYEVLPGPHKLSVAFESSVVISGRRLVLEFEAEAGKTYAVRMLEGEKAQEVSFIVVDAATGKTVSRFKGEEENR
jgi:hypothetical protein